MPQAGRSKAAYSLSASPLVNSAPFLGSPRFRILAEGSVRSRKSRKLAKLKFRYIPGFWVREEAVNGIVSELEARPEYRDMEISEKRCGELITQAIQRLVEERYCPRERRK